MRDLFQFEIIDIQENQNIIIKYTTNNVPWKIYIPWIFTFIRSETKLLTDIEDLIDRVDDTFNWDKLQLESGAITLKGLV
ncbi:MAG: hypothetical protein HeimC3_21500 [Candidatus Heimdallarchaeota archaeon LC_3]|nr:MAG: hypothetical protein HeimC3_21500 [Candidatus Heimdallarchaeota archaeon LC_3]